MHARSLVRAVARQPRATHQIVGAAQNPTIARSGAVVDNKDNDDHVARMNVLQSIIGMLVSNEDMTCYSIYNPKTCIMSVIVKLYLLSLIPAGWDDFFFHLPGPQGIFTLQSGDGMHSMCTTNVGGRSLR